TRWLRGARRGSIPARCRRGRRRISGSARRPDWRGRRRRHGPGTADRASGRRRPPTVHEPERSATWAPTDRLRRGRRAARSCSPPLRPRPSPCPRRARRRRGRRPPSRRGRGRRARRWGARTGRTRPRPRRTTASRAPQERSSDEVDAGLVFWSRRRDKTTEATQSAAEGPRRRGPVGGVFLGIVVIAGLIGVACWERRGGHVPDVPELQLPAHGLTAVFVGLLLV